MATDTILKQLGCPNLLDDVPHNAYETIDIVTANADCVTFNIHSEDVWYSGPHLGLLADEEGVVMSYSLEREFVEQVQSLKHTLQTDLPESVAYLGLRVTPPFELASGERDTFSCTFTEIQREGRIVMAASHSWIAGRTEVPLFIEVASQIMKLFKEKQN